MNPYSKEWQIKKLLFLFNTESPAILVLPFLQLLQHTVNSTYYVFGLRTNIMGEFN